MNVYALTGQGTYGAGVAIVAADSADEAKAIARMVIDDPIWHVRYADADVELLPCVFESGPAQVLTHFESGK